MILTGTRVSGDDEDEVAFYTAFNQFGSEPDPARLATALELPSIQATLALLTEPLTPFPEHYVDYLEQNGAITPLIRGALQLAKATGDPYRLDVVSDGPVVVVVVDDDELVFTVRRLPKQPR